MANSYGERLDIPVNNMDSKIHDETTMSEEEPCNTMESRAKKGGVLFSVNEVPGIGMASILAAQISLMTAGGALAVPLIIANQVCAGENRILQSELLGATIFMSGLCTVLQTFIGIRLPIVQGPSYSFFPPIVAMMALERWKCPTPMTILTGNSSLSVLNSTFLGNQTLSIDVDTDAVWKERMCELSGCLMAASLVQVLLGVTGSIGYIMKYIGPLTLVPCVSLISLSMVDITQEIAAPHWGLTILTVVLTLVCSLYLANVVIPVPYGFQDKRILTMKLPLFRMLAVLVGILCGCIVAIILTVTNVIPPGSPARADYKLHVISNAKWVKVPYPGMWGAPTFSVGGFIGMMAATLASIIESIGDYHVTAQVAEVSNPPAHAINRGIFLEGLESVLSGAVGTGHGTTSYSTGIAGITITKVASRGVFYIAGIFLIVAGIFAKVGAVLTIIPDPVLAGNMIVGMGLLISIGLSYLQFIDLTSTRNMIILGTSLFLGLTVSSWTKANPGAIQTGSDELDQVLDVFLGTAMLVGGAIGMVLDNTVPGTDEERGIRKWRENTSKEGDGAHMTSSDQDIYDLPYIGERLRTFSFLKYIPIFPSYEAPDLNCASPCRRERGTITEDVRITENSSFIKDKTKHLA